MRTPTVDDSKHFNRGTSVVACSVITEFHPHFGEI